MKVLLLSFLLGCLINSSYAQQLDQPYEFPITPEMEKWKSFQSGKEMATACQIPFDILGKLTSKALLETCLNYPLFIEVYTRHDIYEGFDSLKIMFNGFSEFLQRKDAPRHLIDYYQSLNAEKYDEKWSSAQKGAFVFEITKIELLLSQTEIVKRLTKEETDSLLVESHRKYESKKKHSIYGGHSIKNSAVIMGRVLHSLNLLGDVSNQRKTDSVSEFLSSGNTSNSQIIEEISQIAKSYVRRFE